MMPAEFKRIREANRAYVKPVKKKCQYCGGEGDCNGTIDLCANCWEVRKRFEEFIKHLENYHWARIIVDRQALEYQSDD